MLSEQISCHGIFFRGNLLHNSCRFISGTFIAQVCYWIKSWQLSRILKYSDCHVYGISFKCPNPSGWTFVGYRGHSASVQTKSLLGISGTGKDNELCSSSFCFPQLCPILQRFHSATFIDVSGHSIQFVGFDDVEQL